MNLFKYEKGSWQWIRRRHGLSVKQLLLKVIRVKLFFLWHLVHSTEDN